MNYQAINFKDRLGLFSDQWSPRVIAEMNEVNVLLIEPQGVVNTGDGTRSKMAEDDVRV